MDSKGAVRAVFPNAVEHWIPWDESDPFCIAQVYTENSLAAKLLGEGDTMNLAWDSAALNLDQLTKE
jgi:hypothetical protein